MVTNNTMMGQKYDSNKKSTKTIVKTDRDKVSSSIHEITGFDIQTRHICKPHLNGPVFWVASL